MTDKATKAPEPTKAELKELRRKELRQAFGVATAPKAMKMTKTERPKDTGIIDWEGFKADLVEAYLGIPKAERPWLTVKPLCILVKEKYVLPGKKKEKPVYYSEVYRVLGQLITAGKMEQKYDEKTGRTAYRVIA